MQYLHSSKNSHQTTSTKRFVCLRVGDEAATPEASLGILSTRAPQEISYTTPFGHRRYDTPQYAQYIHDHSFDFGFAMAPCPAKLAISSALNPNCESVDSVCAPRTDDLPTSSAGDALNLLGKPVVMTSPCSGWFTFTR